MLLIKKLKEVLLKAIRVKSEAYQNSLPRCNRFGCGKPAVISKEYCIEDMLYCNYCRSDEVSIQLNGYEICSDCLMNGRSKEKPKYRFDGTKNE